MMAPIDHTVHAAMLTHLNKRRNNGSFRQLTLTPESSIDFSSNDFLSLSACPDLKASYLSELSSSSSFRLGSRGSRLLDGNSTYAEDLEKNIATFHNAPAALLFNSGFDANEGFFACVPQPGDVVLFDEYIHASVREGMKLSRAKTCVPFSHNSTSDLKAKIDQLKLEKTTQNNSRNYFVAVEGLYSMDGDLAPLKDIVEMIEETLPKGNGHLVVDEAHSNGIYGLQGRGIVSSLGLESKVFARLHTFGKGLASSGAAILCTPLTREYLINYARPLIYTTAMSFTSLAAVKVVYQMMAGGGSETRISHLKCLIAHMYDQLNSISLQIKHPVTEKRLLQLLNEPPNSPIFALLTPEPKSLAKYCQDGGFMVRAIVPPTVPSGTERVRVCLHAGNTFEDVECLIRRIQDWLMTKGQIVERSQPDEVLIKAIL